MMISTGVPDPLVRRNRSEKKERKIHDRLHAAAML